jgi:hypothetical protein
LPQARRSLFDYFCIFYFFEFSNSLRFLMCNRYHYSVRWRWQKRVGSPERTQVVTEDR